MKKKIITIISVFLVIGALLGVYYIFREQPEEGLKTISIQVKDSGGELAIYKLETDAEFLIDAMNDASVYGLSFEGEEGPYGLMVHTVNGEYADYTETGSYWSFYVNGEYCNYGVSEQPVQDGDAFVIENTKA